MSDNARIKLRFAEILKQNKVRYNHGPIVNIYIVYRLTPGTRSTGIALENCVFDAVELTKRLILINTNILDVVLDLIQEAFFHIQVKDMVEMLLSLELI